MTTTIIGTLNTPGTNTSRLNALGIRRISEADLHLPLSPIPHLIFYGQNPLDTQNPSSYTPTVKKQYLVKKNQKGKQYLIKLRSHRSHVDE